jgi:hypothetical protein
MLVEFVRAVDQDEFSDNPAPQLPIAINPTHVSAVLGNRENGAECIIRLADGRGFRVVGDYPTVMATLRNGGLTN